MLKKLAAIGVSAAIAFAPLAALAQTDQAAPGAAPAGSEAKPMAAKPKKKTHHHMSSSKMAPASSAAPAGGAPAANPQ